MSYLFSYPHPPKNEQIKAVVEKHKQHYLVCLCIIFFLSEKMSNIFSCLIVLYVQGADKTKIRMTIESMNLPTSDQNDCFHFLEIKDYLAGSPGKL